MKRRSAVIYLLCLNAIVASIGVVLVTLLLTAGQPAEGRLAQCDASGDPPVASGGLVPVSNALESIDEAEAFICHDIVYPREAHGWLMEQISASRSRPAADVGRGLGFASVTLDYQRLYSDADLRIEVSPFRIDPIVYGIVGQVQIMGSQANVIQGKDPSRVYLQWEADGFSFFSEAQITDDFGLNDLYAILNSIR